MDYEKMWKELSCYVKDDYKNSLKDMDKIYFSFNKHNGILYALRIIERIEIENKKQEEIK